MERYHGYLVTTHLFLVQKNKILLYLRKGGSQDNMYHTIAGHLDGNESPKTATIREAYEEAGIIIQPQDLHFCNVTHSTSSSGKEYIQFYFSCQTWKGEIINKEPDKCFQMSFFDTHALPTNTTPYIQNAIQNFIHSIPYNEYVDPV